MLNLPRLTNERLSLLLAWMKARLANRQHCPGDMAMPSYRDWDWYWFWDGFPGQRQELWIEYVPELPDT